MQPRHFMEPNRQLVNLRRPLRWRILTQAHWQTATLLGCATGAPSSGRRRFFRLGVKLGCIVWLGLAGVAQAQIQILAVVNSASYQTGIPEPGSLATIFCTGLTGMAGIVSPDTQFPLPLKLAGVQVTVNLGPAPLLAVADLGGGLQQINLQVPPERLLARMSTVRVTQDGALGTVDNVDYPGVGGFFFDGYGSAVARHLADGNRVDPQNAAHAGELIAVYGTGFGPTYPPKPVGFPAPTAPPFQGLMDFTEPNTSYNIDMPARRVSLESKVVHVSFSGVAAGFAGVDQLIIQIPSGLSPGTHSLILATGVISCPPPPLVQPCSFQEKANSNVVKIPVQ